MKAKRFKNKVAGLDHPDEGDFKPSLNMWQRALRQIRQDRATVGAILVIAVLAVFCIAAPIISEVFQVDPITQDLRNNYAPMFSPGHPFGTDELGRDHLSRLLYGGQVSLSIAFAAAFLALGIGIAVGAFAGFYGGILDDFIMWFVTTWNSIPGLFLLILITSLLSPSPLTLVLILGITGWTGTTRLVRAETYSIKEREYVIAARAVGASNLRIMFLHIVPNILSLIIIDLSLTLGALILAESALSFLGFGIRAPTPTWGNMLNGGLDYARRAQHLVFIPGFLITTTVFCFFLLGDGLRDAFDPKIAD